MLDQGGVHSIKNCMTIQTLIALKTLKKHYLDDINFVRAQIIITRNLLIFALLHKKLGNKPIVCQLKRIITLAPQTTFVLFKRIHILTVIQQVIHTINILMCVPRVMIDK
jgi:hypothetical protein